VAVVARKPALVPALRTTGRDKPAPVSTELDDARLVRTNVRHYSTRQGRPMDSPGLAGNARLALDPVSAGDQAAARALRPAVESGEIWDHVRDRLRGRRTA